MKIREVSNNILDYIVKSDGEQLVFEIFAETKRIR